MGNAEAEKAKIERKLQTLQFQNGKLSAQLEVQRSQIAELEGRLEAQETNRGAYADTLLTVNSLWSQLNTDIHNLATRATKGPGHEAAACDAAQLDGAAAAADAQAAPDPYLRALLHGDAKATKEAEERKQDVHEFASDVERQLRARTAATSAALAAVLEQIDASRQATAAATGPPDAVARVAELERECERLTAAADAGAALRRALDAQLQQANAQALKQEESIKDLQNELADRNEELRAAQRKLVTARSQSGAAAVETAGTPPTPAAPAKDIKREASTAGQSIAEIEAAVQAEETKKLLDRRTAELDTEKEAVIKLQKEVRTLKSGLKDDDAVKGSRLYRDLDRRAQGMLAELQEQHNIIGGLHHEIENHRRRGHDLVMQLEQGQHVHVQLQQCERRLAEVSAQLQAAVAERDAAKRDAITAAAAVPQKTTAELQAMLATLQKQNKGLEAAVARHRASAAACEALKAEASAARAALSERDEAVRLANARAAEQRAAADALRGEAVEAAASGDDLRIMVEVLRAVDDGRAAADIRASEAKLRKELQAATAKLNGNAAAAAEARLRDAEAAAAEREAALKAERDGLAARCAGLQTQISDLQAQLAAAKEESDAYIAEIESIGAAYEDMQGQNTRLLAQLADNDRVNSDIVAERVKAVQQAQQAAEEAQQAASRTKDAQAAASSLQDQVTSLQRQLQGMNEEAAQARQAARHAGAQLEAVQREGRDRDAALAERRAAAEAATAALESAKRSADEEAERASREKTKRQRLEDDHKALQAKLERLRKFDTAGADAVLKDEFDGMRKMVRCGVCDSRQKDVILTKCWHMFCQQCIQRNLETRHRKCPGCGAAFGAADVKQIYLG